jgi:hypothetical protein
VEDLQREISQREIDPREKAKELYTAVSRSQYDQIRCLFVYPAKAAITVCFRELGKVRRPVAEKGHSRQLGEERQQHLPSYP